MNFNQIDMQTWNRSKTYRHFLKDVPCTYSMTVNLHITTLLQTARRRQFPFFPAILYGISTLVNQHTEFRMDLDEQGNPGFYDSCNPCCAVFHPDTEGFTNVWTAYDSDFSRFLKNYQQDMEHYQNDAQTDKPLPGKHIFNVSCIPWTSFTGFQLNLQTGYDYFLPIFTLGKYFADGENQLLPIAVQVHHAVCDGFHLARFLNGLQEWADTFAG